MFFEILYNIVVMPIEILVSFTYEFLKVLFDNVGVAIIAVSIVIQTLLLPFYKKADLLQEEEYKKQEQMSKWVKHIRKSFKGDERMMMLSTYYRQQNYSVFQSLNGSLSLLLQIPFFIAAYHFLSVDAKLSGIRFLFIGDLGLPDGLIHVGSVSINILPILMTLVNIVSSLVYTKDKSRKTRVQTFILALVFLVILYSSPSGLVLYWLMNNLYSLGKNIVMKRKSLISVNDEKRKKKANSEKEYQKGTVNYYINKLETSNADYWRMAMLMTLFFGALIPLGLIASSPMEFVGTNYGPAYLVCNTLSVFAGLFFLWGGIIYKQLGEKAKAVFLIFLCGICFAGLVNYYFFGDSKGEVNSLLISSNYGAHFDTVSKNALVCYGVFTVAFLAYMLIKKYMDILIRILAVSFCVISIFNIVTISKELIGFDKSVLETETVITPIIPLSKNGKNVMVIMMDRAISGYVPYIFEERPELVDSFDGFVYYPNTISFGGFTNYGTPPLFGGYEYTPDELNKRDQELLVDKHDEALLVLPTLFGEEEFEVTVCDPPYVGYEWIPDLSLYNGVPNTTAYITEGRYLESTGTNKELAKLECRNVLKHNFIYYPLVKTEPLMLQAFLNPRSGSLIHNISVDNSPFAKWYSVIKNLCKLTKIEEDGDTLLVFQNSTTHEPIQLDLPDYTFPDGTMGYEQRKALQPQIEINGVKVKLDNEDQLAHYQSNVVTYIELAKWFDYLKQEGVYDNTKIILVSDHGRDLKQFDYMKLSEDVDVQIYNALFMVKDFGATGFSTSDEFMTVADVATYATEGVIDNPINPFTGKEINNDEKYAHPQLITDSENFTVNTVRTTFDTSKDKWFSVHDDIFDADNWEEVDYNTEN